MGVRSAGLMIMLAAMLASCDESAAPPENEQPAEDATPAQPEDDPAPVEEEAPPPPPEPVESRTFEDYLTALAVRESSSNPNAENSLGYLGLYQTGEIALIDVDWYAETPPGETRRNDWVGSWLSRAQTNGANSKATYLGNVPAQNAAIRRYYDKVWIYVRHFGLDDYEGETINGILITRSGLLAGWHLLGGGLIDYLESGGADASADAYGTHIEEYISTFGGYDTPYTN